MFFCDDMLYFLLFILFVDLQWDALRVLDRDPANSSNVWLLYANRTEPYITNGE